MLPADVSERRFSDRAGLDIYRHNLSSLLRSQACAATPACRLKPASFATCAYRSSSSTAGSVCRVPTVGALGEHFAPLLWPHCNSIANRAPDRLLHRIFIDAIQLQVAVFYVTLQNTLTFEKLGYTVTDRVNQFHQFLLI